MNLQNVQSKHKKEVERPTESQLLEILRAMFPALKDVSDLEVFKAINVAKHLGLDPIKKEVHFVPFKGQVQLVVSYLEYVKRAERSGKLKGWSVDLGKDEQLGIYAEVTIYRKDWELPFKWKVYLCEAQKDTITWKQSPTFMLKKTAIAQAFRIAFPEEISYMPYTFDEVSYDEGTTEQITPLPEGFQKSESPITITPVTVTSEIPKLIQNDQEETILEVTKKPINESQVKIIKRELQNFLTESPDLLEGLKKLTFEDGVKVISLLRSKQHDEAWNYVKSKLETSKTPELPLDVLDENAEEEEEYENLEEFYTK